jgi:uncharacterized Zn-finger protein
MPSLDQPPSSAGSPALPSGDRTEPFDVATVAVPEVACQGVPGEEGHPLIYMTFGEEPEIMCPYCSRRFRRADALSPGPH